MIRPSPRVIATIPLFRRLRLSTDILRRTVARLSQCRSLDSIVLLTDGDAPPPQVHGAVVHHVASLTDLATDHRLAARKWSPTAWRGGLAGATCYDEALAPTAMVSALETTGAAAALIVGADWPLVDPALCDAVIERHLSQADRLKLVFTQAPPGLCGCLVTADLLIELRDKHAMIGSLLDYQPRVPQGDPIGKDPCVHVEPHVRNCPLRFIHDAPRWQRLIDALPPEGSAADIVAAASPLASTVHEAGPQQVTIDLVAPGRPNLTLDQARRIFASLTADDLAVTFGQLGDPLLHPDWPALIATAPPGSVHVRTDLNVDEATLQKLLDARVDIISVNLSADTAETYKKITGRDDFRGVIGNIEWLLNHRRHTDRPLLPWIVPRFVKTAENVHELESFFDRWVYFCGHAIVESPTTGCGAAPDRALMDMSPPRRRPCRQINHRMTIHSGGAVALCDQDWNGSLGDDPAAAWKSITAVRAAHDAGNIPEPCTRCREWHRP